MSNVHLSPLKMYRQITCHHVNPNNTGISTKTLSLAMVKSFNSRDEESLNMICSLLSDKGANTRAYSFLLLSFHINH